MRTHHLCAFLVITVGAGLVMAQSTSTAQANATVPSAKKVAKPVADTPEKFLVEVHVLQAQAAVSQPSASKSCYSGGLLFPATNAAEVAKNLTEKGYTFEAIPPDRIKIYYKERTNTPPNLSAVRENLNKLAIADVRNIEAITVPRGTAAKTIQQLNLPSDSAIRASAVDDDCILLLSKTNPPDPVVLATLQRNLPQLYWRSESTQPTQRLFHLDATTVVKQLASSTDSGSGKPTTDDSSSDVAVNKPAAGASVPIKPGTSSTSKASPTPGNTLAQSIAVSVAAGGGPADSPAGDNAGTPDPSKGSAKTPADGAKKDAATAPKPLTMKAVGDTLVYSNDDGSDRGIFERNRLMTVLDLPRPEVLMNIWSLQVSTKDSKRASEEAETANELISHHNEALENSIEQGWDFLSRSIRDRGEDFFEPRFYEYVTQKFAEDKTYIENADPLSDLGEEAMRGCEPLTKEEKEKEPEISSQEIQRKKELCERKKKLEKIAKENWDLAVGSQERKRWGWCDPNRYCLGFIHAFEPVRPTLTNILLTIMAAKESQETADGAISAMECVGEYDSKTKTCKTSDETRACTKGSRVDESQVGRFEKCVSGEQSLLATLEKEAPVCDCELEDRIELLNRIVKHNPEQALQLHCFKEQADQSFGPAKGKRSDYAATRVGLLRAAVADFLFNYKWATEYPHDFIPYDLTQSAQELNAEFNPLVLAFNRDVKAFTQNLETELECKHEANSPRRSNPGAWLKKDQDETFLNDGMISVRGISGVESIVDTVTQSFFNATNPPSLTDLVKAVGDAEKNVPGVLKANLSADEAAVLLGALNSVQPAESKIGRELKLDITPHTLAGASSAELEVKLTADETGNPTLYKGGNQTEDTISRVAKHDTNTRVRVESLKLFDVSSFSAMLQRPRSKFPLLPPFVEVPYFGTFVGWPLAGAKVYHRSTAIVSAIIVPTAADLAFGIEFSTDRVCNDSNNPNQPLTCHSARSPRDFGSLPLRSFHKAIVQCFASGGKTAYAGLIGNTLPDADAKDNACAHLSLVNSDGGTPHNTEEERKIPPESYVPPL